MKAKVKKFYSKVSLFVVMIAMLCAGFIPAFGQMVIKAKNVATSDIVSVESIPTTGVRETEIDIKKGKVAGAYSDEVKITITDCNGNSVVCDTTSIELGYFAGTIEHDAGNNKYVLVPTEGGDYKVVYSYEPATGAKVFSREYKITITENEAEFKEESQKVLTVVNNVEGWVSAGSKINAIIPAEMNDSQNYTYFVPLLNVADENGDLIEDADVSISITDANGSELANYREITVKTAEESESRTTIAFKPNSGVFGYYTITYAYDIEGGSTIYDYVNFYVAQQSAFNPKQDLEFTSATFDSTFPETLCLDTTVTLPSVNVDITNKNTKETSKNNCVVSVSVFKQGNVAVSTNGFSFYVDEVCDYYVQYTIVDAFGNTKKLELKTILKANVKDTQKPEVQVVLPYEINQTTDKLLGDEEDLKDATNYIPTKFYQSASPFYIYYENSEGKYTDANGVALSEEDQYNPEKWVKVNDQQYVATIYLPAIYAKDNATEKFSDFSAITRQISNGTTNFNIDALSNTDKDLAGQKVIVQGLSTGFEKGAQINEAVAVHFAEAGEYTLSYFATDKNKNTSDKLTFTITIAEEGEIDSELPTVSIKGIPSSVMQNTTVEFDAPSATDDSDGTRIQTYTYYFFDDEQVLASENINGVTTDTTVSAIINKSDVAFATLLGLKNADKMIEANVVDGRISIDAGTNSKLTVVSFAIDNYQQYYGVGNVGITVREVVIYAETHDADAPIIASVIKPANYDFKLYDETDKNEQGFYDAGSSWAEDTTFDGKFVNVHKDKAVKLPTFKFTDSDSNVVVKAQIYRENGDDMLFVEEFSIPTTKTTSAGTTTYLTQAKSFVPTVGDVNYKLVIVAKDSFENVSFVAFDFAVKQWLEIDVVLNKDFQTEADFNESIEIPDVRVFATNTSKKGSDITGSADVQIELIGNQDEFNSRTNIFVGSQNNHAYEFKYTIFVEGMKEAKVLEGKDYIITVKDSTKPEIKLIGSGYKVYNSADDDTIVVRNLVKTSADSKTYADISFPYFTATDNAEIKNVSVEVTYDENKKSITHTVSDDNKTITFNPIYADGNYYVTYTATDINDLVTTNVYRIAVGDTDNPVIIIGDVNKFGTKSLNSTVEIITTSAGISVFDAKSSLVNFGNSSSPRYFDLVIKAPSGAETKYSELKDNKFTFKESGNYTFTYTAKDEAGNINPGVVVEVKVLASEVETTKDGGNNIVLPIIIIVASLLILGFVVWYFLADHKKRGGKGKKNKEGKAENKSAKKEKSDNDNDKIVV